MDTKSTKIQLKWYNNYFAETVGKKPEEMYGKTDIENGWNPDLVRGNPEKEIRGYEHDDRDALSGKLVHMSNDIAYVDGRKLIFDTIKVPLYDEVGAIIGLLGVSRDVTEQRQIAEQQLQKLSLVASKTTNAVIITDAKGCITWVNEGFTRISGYSFDEVLGKIPGDFLQGEMTDPATVQTMKKALNLGIGFDVEIVNYTKSQHPYWLQIKVDPFYNERDELEGFVAVETDITKRKQQEIALLESEERYRLIFERSSEGVLQASLDGTIEAANPEACRVLGWSKEEIIGLGKENILDLGDPRYQDLWKVRSKKGFVKGEMNCFRKDGSKFPCEFSSTIYTDAHSLERSAIFFRDVSERKKAEDELRKSVALFDAVLQSLSEGMTIIGHDGAIQLSNHSAEKILGLTSDQMSGRDSFDPRWGALYEDGTPFPGELHPPQITLKTGEPQHNIVMGITKPDNSLCWVSCNSEPIILKGEMEMYGVVATFSDITVRKAAEQQLRFQTELLNSIVLSITDGIVLVDEHRSIVLVNPAAERIFNYTNEELIGQPLSLLIPRKSHLTHERHIQTFIHNEKSIPFRRMDGVQGQRKGEELFSIEASIAQFTVDGKLFLLAGVRDITKRLEAEEEILQLNRTLTQRVEERTADLVRLNKEKDDFLSLAAHDLKNPLAAIRSSAQIIEECFIAEETIDFAEYADSIISTTDEMLEIITNFLDIELIENGKLGLALENVPLEIVSKVVESHRKRASAKGITIHLQELQQIERIIADRLALKQVLDNLLSNAVKYSPRGKTITVRVLERQENRELNRTESAFLNVIRIEIQDEGPGIREEEQHKLFVKFMRLSSKPTAEEGSTGLGLSIVKRLVEMMNGRVWCESTEGNGATFIIELPMV